jgi:hypothetical protein
MKDDVLEAAPQTGARFEQNTEVARLVETLASVYYRFDVDVDRIRGDRYLETATGIELDMRARPVGVQRPTGERDQKFRQRALAGRARSLSETTFDDVARVALAALDADPDQVTLDIGSDGDELGAVIIEATSAVYDAAPFSEQTIISILEGAIPMSRRVVLRRRDGFQFSTDATAEGKGFGEGVWTQ